MRVNINIKMHDDNVTLKYMESKGYTKQKIIDTYNQGVKILMKGLGGNEELSPSKNIEVNTEVYDKRETEVSLYVVYVEEDIYLVKAHNKKEAINIVYDNEIDLYHKYAKDYVILKSDLRAVPLNELMKDHSFISLS